MIGAVSVDGNNRNQNVNSCTSLAACHPFCPKLLPVTKNHAVLQWQEQKKALTERQLLEQKLMLRIWWDEECVAYYELLPKNVSITAEVYCQQLCRL